MGRNNGGGGGGPCKIELRKQTEAAAKARKAPEKKAREAAKLNRKEEKKEEKEDFVDIFLKSWLCTELDFTEDRKSLTVKAKKVDGEFVQNIKHDTVKVPSIFWFKHIKKSGYEIIKAQFFYPAGLGIRHRVKTNNGEIRLMKKEGYDTLEYVRELNFGEFPVEIIEEVRKHLFK